MPLIEDPLEGFNRFWYVHAQFSYTKNCSAELFKPRSRLRTVALAKPQSQNPREG